MVLPLSVPPAENRGRAARLDQAADREAAGADDLTRAAVGVLDDRVAGMAARRDVLRAARQRAAAIRAAAAQMLLAAVDVAAHRRAAAQHVLRAAALNIDAACRAARMHELLRKAAAQRFIERRAAAVDVLVSVAADEGAGIGTAGQILGAAAHQRGP